MAMIEIGGRTFDVDGDGYLSDPGVWDKETAILMARYDGIEEMNDKHWAVVNFIRNNFEEKGMAPMVRTICQETGIRLREIYNLFPLGPARGACRIAGLPKPDGCI